MRKRKNKIKDNDFLLNINLEKLTDKQKAVILAQVIDNELEKNEKDADQDLVEECLDYIEELNGGMFKKSDEDLDNGLVRIYSKSKQEKEIDKKYGDKKTRISDRKRVRRMATVLVAAVLAVFVSLTVIAQVIGYDSADEWIASSFEELLDLRFGKYEYKTKGITIIKGNKTEKYSDIEELLDKEGLDIMYPSVLPEKIKITHIYITFYEDDKFDIVYQFSSRSVSISVYNYDLSRYSVTSEHDIIESNGYKFGVFQVFDQKYQANCITEKYAYCITADSYDALITVIQNMKGC